MVASEDIVVVPHDVKIVQDVIVVFRDQVLSFLVPFHPQCPDGYKLFVELLSCGENGEFFTITSINVIHIVVIVVNNPRDM